MHVECMVLEITHRLPCYNAVVDSRRCRMTATTIVSLVSADRSYSPNIIAARRSNRFQSDSEDEGEASEDMLPPWSQFSGLSGVDNENSLVGLSNQVGTVRPLPGGSVRRDVLTSALGSYMLPQLIASVIVHDARISQYSVQVGDPPAGSV